MIIIGLLVKVVEKKRGGDVFRYGLDRDYLEFGTLVNKRIDCG